MHGNRRPTPEAVLPDRLPTPGEMHDHPHDHAEDDDSILLTGGRQHLEYHRTHRGYGHHHAHTPGFDHHAPRP